MIREVRANNTKELHIMHVKYIYVEINYYLFNTLILEYHIIHCRQPLSLDC